MGSCNSPTLCAFAIFKSIIHEELIRSCHIYQLNGGNELGLEREFVFSKNSCYMEMAAQPLLKLSTLEVSELCQGKTLGIWECMLAFNINHPCKGTSVPSVLSISGNPKLKAISILFKDLQFVTQMIQESEDADPTEVADKDICETSSERSVPVLDQDLNCFPYTIGGLPSPSPSENQRSMSPPAPEPDVEDMIQKKKKKKRAVSERVATITLEDLVKYFDYPISEASRHLKVGLTVLKRKCRELGITRWPHRKIKSLDSLINDLQEEAERQEKENTAAAMAVKKRQKMLEKEKENIEKKPAVDIDHETKRFRQEVFKRRHRARHLNVKL